MTKLRERAPKLKRKKMVQKIVNEKDRDVVKINKLIKMGNEITGENVELLKKAIPDVTKKNYYPLNRTNRYGSPSFTYTIDPNPNEIKISYPFQKSKTIMTISTHITHIKIADVNVADVAIWYDYLTGRDANTREHFQIVFKVFTINYDDKSDVPKLTYSEISTPVSKSKTDLMNYCTSLLSDDENNPYKTKIVVKIKLNAYLKSPREVGRGGQSYQQITSKYLIISPSSKKNCLWTSIAICRKFKDKIEMLTDTTVQNAAGAYLKKTVKPSSTEYSDDNSIEEFCAKYKVKLTKYNNLFESVEFGDKKFKDGGIKVQLRDGHFVAMVKKKDILEKYPDFVFSEPVVEDETKEDIERKIVKFPSTKEVEYDRDMYIAYDIETYNCGGFHKAYKIGLACYEGNETIYESFSGADCIDQFMDYIMDNIDYFQGRYFYAHNGGKFDLNILIREGFLKNDFAINGSKCVELNGSWIGFTVSYQDKPIYFRDSYRVFVGSLDDLCKDLKVKHQKLTGSVEHHLVNESNCDEYAQSEIVEAYLKNDCLGLLEIIDIFASNIAVQGLHLYSCLTAASIAKKSFYQNYFPKTQDLYTLSNKQDAYLRPGYFGGMVQCFALGKVEGKIYYYDFTSLYPDVGRKSLPYGKPMYKSNSWELNQPQFTMGFIRCIVTGTKEMLKGNKPLHAYMVDGKLEFPYVNGVEMTLFKPEIEYGKTLGYTYKFIDGYRFYEKEFLKDCFQDAFKKKAEANKNQNAALEYYYKLVANSTYGFFGFKKLNRDGVIIGKNLDYGEYLETGKLVGYGEMTDDCQILRIKKDLDIRDVNVAVAFAITSYARMKTYGLINDIENLGHKVYYCDTDSIITDFNLKSNETLAKKYQWDGCGNELGSLKNECEAKLKKMWKSKPELPCKTT